ncbi:MAG: UDP-glucose/GDP-mannose dehydrogenase family protein [Anaerolineae bacterium]|nr:UDP-glucose/GDP-mannose dehydrogenase family protein [Anaerolineae bacterium]
MKNIAVIGVGYVGLVTAAAFSDLGNRVMALDISEEKIANLKKNIMPIYEPGLAEMVERNVRAGRLSFTTNYEEALEGAEFAFICVGTPEGVDGEADLQYVRMAAETIARTMKQPLIIINKSTVPVGTGDWVSDIVQETQLQPIDFAVVSCPEFLREGSAIGDFMNPDRTVLGSENQAAADAVAQLHLPLRAPIVVTDLRTAEMIKYASNAFLATKISFINEIANICESLGADVEEVARGMGFDKRIGPRFLNAGVGYGGSCFPKDVKALKYMAQLRGKHPQLLEAVIDINDFQRKTAVLKVRELLDGSVSGKVIGLLGLAFKPGTDDMREAPALTIAEILRTEGATVRGYDPVSMENVARTHPWIELKDNAYDLVKGCDAVIVVTEWNEFKQLDMAKVRDLLAAPNMVDGRNVYDPAIMREFGFNYRAVGRGFEGKGVRNGAE